MRLDGQLINVGQSVYDLAFGAGIVNSITLGVGLSVKFPDGFSQGYNENGKGQFANRTLYIAPPDIFTPLLDVQKRSLFSRVARALHTEMGVA